MQLGVGTEQLRDGRLRHWTHSRAAVVPPSCLFPAVDEVDRPTPLSCCVQCVVLVASAKPGMFSREERESSIQGLLKALDATLAAPLYSCMSALETSGERWCRWQERGLQR